MADQLTVTCTARRVCHGRILPQLRISTLKACFGEHASAKSVSKQIVALGRLIGEKAA